MSLVKLLIRYCTSGEMLPNFICVLAPRIAMGSMAERMQTLVREMHAQYGRCRCVWKFVRRRPVAPHMVASARKGGVGGSMDDICSVNDEDDE